MAKNDRPTENANQADEEYHIRAYSSLVDTPLHILKYGDSFVVLNHFGNIRPYRFEKHGLFHQGTRFLSQFVLYFNSKSPLFLSSNVKEYNDFLTVDLTNPDWEVKENLIIHTGNVHLVRIVFLLEGVLYEQLRIRNYGTHFVEFFLSYNYEADFADIFEIRGMVRPRRGTLLTPVIRENAVSLAYLGLDKLRRTTIINFNPGPEIIKSNQVYYPIQLKPKEEKLLELSIECHMGESVPPKLSSEMAYQKNYQLYQSLKEDICTIETSNVQFNNWLKQSQADLFMLLTKTLFGYYPYAGIPWFSTVFGRDGLITAMETLWIYPHLARGVLYYLAHQQAKKSLPLQDAEPGKILHEQRLGEMVALEEVPFGQYYGSIDATPLFISLAYDYYLRTFDLEAIKHLWPAVEQALLWIDQFGDIDKDGFVEYQRKVEGGLLNQGWKDSEDAVFHQDGALAELPIALCEVQGYVYAARSKAAHLALLLGHEQQARTLKQQAEQLKMAFQQAFWCEEIGMYALALDKNKKPCCVKSSNPGHCLFTGIAAPEHARIMVKNFMQPDFFTGWGIRTISSDEKRYNPMSYHNGTIWPHDNALIGYGMSLYGFRQEALKIMASLFDASTHMRLYRLPELYCGFKRRPHEGPTLYPVACNPQAWASAAVFLLLQACLGLRVDAPAHKIYFQNTVLPDFLAYIKIFNLRVGSASVDIQLTYHPQDVGITVMKREGDVEIINIK
jgi:glycogen debranching enzyme